MAAVGGGARPGAAPRGVDAGAPGAPSALAMASAWSECERDRSPELTSSMSSRIAAACAAPPVCAAARSATRASSSCLSVASETRARSAERRFPSDSASWVEISASSACSEAARSRSAAPLSEFRSDAARAAARAADVSAALPSPVATEGAGRSIRFGPMRSPSKSGSS
eukprot:scaffold23804_cov23-Tisochrysis_lutea.AAC.3